MIVKSCYPFSLRNYFMDFNYNNVIIGVSNWSGRIEFGYIITVADLYGAQIKVCILNKEVRTIPNANVFHTEMELSIHITLSL
jgi:hypothetical protein